MARPLSPLTKVLREAMQARGDLPATWRDAADELARQGLINLLAPAETRLVRQTMKDMAKRGELRKAAEVRVPGSRRPMAGWVARGLPSSNGTGAAMCPTAALQSAIKGWRG